MGNIESIVTSFCKRTKTADIPWFYLFKKFARMYGPGVSQEDFELCLLKQGRKVALAMSRLLRIKHKEQGQGFDELHKRYGITEGFWNACVKEDQRPHINGSELSDRVSNRTYHRNPTKIYMTVFRVPASEYTKESLGILKRFVESLKRPMEIIECTNPPAIEIREIR